MMDQSQSEQDFTKFSSQKDTEMRASRATVDSNQRQTPNDFSIRSNQRFKSKCTF